MAQCEVWQSYVSLWLSDLQVSSSKGVSCCHGCYNVHCTLVLFSVRHQQAQALWLYFVFAMLHCLSVAHYLHLPTCTCTMPQVGQQSRNSQSWTHQRRQGFLFHGLISWRERFLCHLPCHKLPWQRPQDPCIEGSGANPASCCFPASSSSCELASYLASLQ